MKIPVLTMTPEEMDRAIARIAEVMEKVKEGVKPEPRYSVLVFGDLVILEPLSYYLEQK